MSNVRVALIYSSLGRYALMIVGLINTVVVARLLSPEEIGTFAIASSVVMIMAEFRILGANTYLIREKELTKDKIMSAYGLTLLISWGLGVFVVVAAMPASKFFNIPDLTNIFFILSVSFIFAPYISIPNALLSREYKFKEITIIRLCSSLTNISTTVLFILNGFSYYSLAFGNLSSVLVQFSLYMYFTRSVKVYRPRFADIKPIAKLGIFMSFSHVVRRAHFTIPDMIIGKVGGPGQVGIFSRGLGFMVFVSDALLSGISPVALPYLSDVRKRNESMVKAYTRAAQLIVGVVWPVLAVASVASLPAIRLMFGDQWDSSAPIASVLAFWAMLRASHVLAPQALVAVGKEGAMLLKEIVVLLFFLMLIFSVYPKWGLLGVGYAFIFSGFIDFLVSSYFMKLKVELEFFVYLRSLFSSVVVAASCWMSTYLISCVFPYDTTAPIFSLLQISIVLPVVWISTIFITKHPIKNEIIRLYKIKFGN
ncbi:oligosaccharide flippase family protein [Marinobacter sp. 2_MG-2023]|uniref:oligosaccharide flippase family protein n=1 Tax=Marinobacter sp. 2_MG-2023 TaxID=3062679 RepID=UPI0026E473A6|nr:oligosaccharide flippase family protein [Marinobacter sp. 2_MG-2023]MDO6442524.1 oligosaccharide flippase family protein [Marinobacter sp. 2_MG-2023]